MSVSRWSKLLALMLAGAWLPVVVTCQPTGWDGVVRVVTDGWYRGGWVQEDYEDRYYYADTCCDYWDGWGGWGSGFYFHYDD